MTMALPTRAEVVSGEAVELDVRYARAGSRALALMIDMAVQVLVSLALLAVVLTVTTASLGDLVDEALIQAVTVIVLIVVFVVYPTLTETLTNGRSLGKRALGLRVVREDGGPIRMRHALTRALIGLAVEWPGLIFPPFTWAVGLGTSLSSGQGRRLGDLAAGTYVVHERSPAAWGWVPAMPPHLAGWAATLDLAALDDDLALAVRHFLARSQDISQPMHDRFAWGLSAEVSERIAHPMPAGVPPWVFLSAVLAERRRRSGSRVHATRALTQRIWPGFGRPEWPSAGAPTWDPAVPHRPLLGVVKENQSRS
jgi:uncharacterized RDD family membrane protein YckC